MGSWKEGEQQPPFGDVLALALGSFADFCGAGFLYFRGAEAAVGGSGDADSSYTEKREDRFVQHSTHVVCAVEKRIGKALAIFNNIHTVVQWSQDTELQ